MSPNSNCSFAVSDAFYNNAIAGRLDVCKKLSEKFHYTNADTKVNTLLFASILREAAKNGHLYVCKWIYETFHLTPQEVIDPAKHEFICAVKNRGSETYVWIHDTFWSNY